MSRSPISALEHNIAPEIERVARLNSIDMEGVVAAQLVDREIDLVCDPISPRGPHADHVSKKVVLYESHLAFIWAYIYSHFVIFERCIQQPMLEGAFDWTISFDCDLTKRAKLLQDWSYEFAKGYIPWDEERLPSPRACRDNEEKVFCEKVNQIYMTAVTFLFYHEYAHLTLKHTSDREDQDWSLEQEKEADNYSMSCIVQTFSSEKDRWIAGLSIVLLSASNLCLPKDFRGIWQAIHPHLHDRVRNALTSLNLQSEQSKYYLYHLGCICLQTWFANNGLESPRATADTAESLFYDYLERIDQLDQQGYGATRAPQ